MLCVQKQFASPVVDEGIYQKLGRPYSVATRQVRQPFPGAKKCRVVVRKKALKSGDPTRNDSPRPTPSNLRTAWYTCRTVPDSCRSCCVSRSGSATQGDCLYGHDSTRRLLKAKGLLQQGRPTVSTTRFGRPQIHMFAVRSASLESWSAPLCRTSMAPGASQTTLLVRSYLVRYFQYSAILPRRRGRGAVIRIGLWWDISTA